jgi:carboxylate-amine ligase
VTDGWGSTLTVGVEEELMIVDAATLQQVPRVRTLLAAAEGRDLPGVLKTELFASVVELNTPRCDTPAGAAEVLAELRRDACELAGGVGLALMAAGSHPVSEPREQEIADEPRYEDFVRYAGVSARRQGVQGLHVHVGMPDADRCLRVLETILPWLPVVLAVSANSPYLAGQESGLASSRAEVLALLPRSGAPPRFDRFADWSTFVERLTRIGLINDYTTLWWDVRAHPRFGTLEIRMPDQPTDVGRSGALVAVLHAMCAAAIDAEPPPRQPGDRQIYRQNRWAALRFGPSAELVHADEERLAPARELWDELLARSGADVPGFDIDANEGERQLAIGRERGLHAVCEDLAERSLASD